MSIILSEVPGRSKVPPPNEFVYSRTFQLIIFNCIYRIILFIVLRERFGYHPSSRAAGRIVGLLRAGGLRLAADDRILSEYADALRRPRLSPYFAGQDVTHILDHLLCNSERLIATTRIASLPDAHDAPFLELAKAAGAILVTENLEHFPILKPCGVTAESPVDFVRRFE